MGNVVILPCMTNLPLPIERVLDGGKDARFVLLLAFDKDGQFTAAASEADLQKCADMAQRFLTKLYRGDFNKNYPDRE